MGIMSTKMTRRVALGSIAAGLGGAAFVIRTIKGRHEHMPSDEKFAKYLENWQADVKMLDVPLSTTEGPSTFRFGYRPFAQNFRAALLRTTYQGRGEFPALPSCIFSRSAKLLTPRIW